MRGFIINSSHYHYSSTHLQAIATLLGLPLRAGGSWHLALAHAVGLLLRGALECDRWQFFAEVFQPALADLTRHQVYVNVNGCGISISS
jgi:hypothetical protein